MKVDTHHLRGWKHFCATCRADGESFCSPETRTTLNRFYARYRLALKFEAVYAHGYSERAMRGYTAGLRLLAAYSAAELLGEATDEKVVGWEIKDPKLALALRKSLSRANRSQNGVFSDARLKQRLDRFMAGDDDVRVAATALRVMVAHGSFTPTGADSLTKAGAEALQRLSDVLLQECEQRFARWLHDNLARHGGAA
ncbi:hypothetical protein N5J07_06585 [Comamonas aquatica]|uniref:hypothetical protein n=1 Tax=Comamonas aquatica TaxID=225991 RepID=UPI00244CE678|nr:hypothetical protein [Comamonas aquatica]MDH1379128.1 hypothetical protein [Comamonas aquatica]MDH1639164.1 hypothetical protein [Comamonas aquatica]